MQELGDYLNSDLDYNTSTNKGLAGCLQTATSSVQIPAVNQRRILRSHVSSAFLLVCPPRYFIELRAPKRAED